LSAEIRNEIVWDVFLMQDFFCVGMVAKMVNWKGTQCD